MKILVTGGAGFIGSHFVRTMLASASGVVINLDKLTYAGNLQNLVDVGRNANYKFVKGDICSPSIVQPLVRSVDVIVNFAAETHVDRSIANAANFIRTDVLGAYHLLEATRKYDKKLIQVSTDEVYGSTSESFSERDNLIPSSPYAASKAGADLLALAYFKTYGIDVMLTRSSNNYGPNQHPEKMIPLFTTNAIRNKHLPVYGDGQNVRDWLHVHDNCQAIKLVIEKGKKGEVYNVGSGNERTNIQVAKSILYILKKPHSLIQFVRDRPGHDRRYSLKWGKIRKLGWDPRTSFEDGLKKTIDWYEKNSWWWKPLVKE